jgi:3-oxoacyl-[acyl-carrier-protein] synthase II
MTNKRIVITGTGVVAPNGIGKEAYWEALRNGKSGFKTISLFDTSDLLVHVAGEITDLNPKEILGQPVSKDLGRATVLLLCAVKMALSDAKVEITDTNAADIGISIGTTFGSIHYISEFDKEALREGPRYANPSLFPNSVANAPASHIAIKFKIKGFNTTLSTGMCAGADALAYACNHMNLYNTKAIIVGGVEDLCIQTFLGFYKLGYLSGLKNKFWPTSSPFDKRRDGVIFSEGSAAFMLEERSEAHKRHAPILGEILGFGSSFDPTRRYKYSSQGKGMIESMKAALDDAHLKPHDIDCVFANANSTKHADEIETTAIKAVFTHQAHKIPVTAIKSMVGESYSASGAFALAAAIEAIKNQCIPPTINLKEKDPHCDLDYVPNVARDHKISRAMINCFGPNGQNTCIIVGKA